LDALRLAKHKLESPSFAVELAALIGRPLESGLKFLPKRLSGNLTQLTEAALVRAVDLAINSLGDAPAQTDRSRLHRWLSAGSGAAGGALGIWGVAVEIPVSTTLMLRSIADIARDEGHDLARIETRLACLEVFALGSSKSSADDTAETSYWIIRAALGKAFADAAIYISQRGLVAEGAPPLVRLAATLAGRFSVNISARIAATAIPVVSAASGASINWLFMQHYQEMARGHFIVKRLEARYGEAAIRQAYTQLTL
jgi:hypothetical protein